MGLASQLPDLTLVQAPLNLLIIEDTLPETDFAENKNLNLITLSKSADLATTHHEVKEFLKTRQILSRNIFMLYECLVSGKGLKSIVDLGQRLMGNPISVSDASHKVLAYSQQSFIDDPIWNEIHNNGYCPYETIQMSIVNGVPDKAFKAEKPTIIQVNYEKYRLMSWGMVSGHRIIGQISVLEYHRPFNESDPELLMSLCNVVVCELQKEHYHLRQASRLGFEHLIADLLDELLPNQEAIKERLKFININLSKSLILLVSGYLGDLKINVPIPYLGERLENIIHGSNYSIYKNRLILLVSRPPKATFTDFELKALTQLLSENRIIAGISRSFPDIRDLKEFYIQAQKAAEMGTRLGIEKSLYFYDDFSDYYLVDAAAEHHDLRKLCSPLLYRLIEYDVQNNSDLVQSLITYLACGNNLAETARALGIHRNSMDYRITKIEDSFNISIDDPTVTFSLNSSVRILQYYYGVHVFQPEKLRHLSTDILRA